MPLPLRSALLCNVFLLGTLLCEADAKKRKKATGRHEERFGEFRKLSGWLLLAVFGPVIFAFLWAVAKDPAMPGLMTELGRRIKENSSAFLGRGPKYKAR